MTQTVAELVGRCLLAQGTARSYGPREVPGLRHVPVDDPVLARLLADADGRVGSAPGVAFLADGTLRLSSRPGTIVKPTTVPSADRLPGELASWTIGEVHATRELRLDLDPEEPVDDAIEPLELETGGDLYALSPTLADVGMVCLAGPGVVRDGHVDSLQAFAAQAGCGVLNTWGAKGVFAWDSPFHFGTGGLQERDLELAGILDADVVVAVGLDPDEVPVGQLADVQVLDVEPWQLPALAFTWPEPDEVPERPRLYTELYDALQPLYDSDAVPLTPARAAGDLAAARPGGALVAADPGPAGLWVARGFPTTEPASVVVPATVARGFAAAAALCAALAGRRAVAVTTSPVDDVTHAVMDLAGALGVPLPLLEWGGDAGLGSVEDHRGLLETAWAAGEPHVWPVPVDFAATATLVDVCGPVTAWPTDEIA